MTKSKLFLIFSLSFIIGVAASSFYYPRILGGEFIYILAILALIILAVFYGNKTAVVVSIAVLFFAFGIFLTNIKLNKLENLDLDGKDFSGTVKITKEPAMKTKIQQLIVRPVDNKTIKFLINTDPFAKYAYGDNLEISCMLKIPSNENLDFDWRMYLAKDGVFYECQKAKIKKLDQNSGNKIYTALLKIKNKFDGNISKLIPAPESGLLSGLLIGGDDRLSKNIQENFSKTGLTHIVAVSGYNVTIIAEYLMILGIFLGLWRRQSFWFAVAGIILFVIIVGLPSSAVRAGVMGILLIWAMKNGRLANSQNAILFSAAVMLLFNPLLLRWDIGFQLSFLATVGIIYFYPIFNNWAVKKNKTFGLTEILFLTLSAQIFVLPVILYNFKQLSLISPLANLLVLPIVPLAMLLGFAAIVSSFIFFPLGQILSWPAFLLLKYETLAINYLAGLKYASVEIKLTWWGVIVWYIILIAGAYFIKKRKLCQNEN